MGPAPRPVAGRARAWTVLTAVLLVHALDEYFFDFPAEYNTARAALLQLWPWLPMPVVTPGDVLVGLLAATLALAALIPVVRPDRIWARLLSLNYGLIMAANGIGHLLFSAFAGRPLAGARTSPLMIAAAVWLVYVELKQTASDRAAPPSSNALSNHSPER